MSFDESCMPALYVDATGAWLREHSKTRQLSIEQALVTLEQNDEILICNKALTLARLGRNSSHEGDNLYDILALFAFVHPTQFCVPSPMGIATTLQKDLATATNTLDWHVVYYYRVVAYLLNKLQSENSPETRGIALFMGKHGWIWAPLILEMLEPNGKEQRTPKQDLEQWHHLPRWTTLPEKETPLNIAISKTDTARTLHHIIKASSGDQREEQKNYMLEVVRAFGIHDKQTGPNVVVAEGETGVGKTLGYLVPAMQWATNNGSPVWISTYSRYLQNQLETEFARFFKHSEKNQQQKNDHKNDRENIVIRDVVVRQGRENYLCLLNYEDAISDIAIPDNRAITLGYVARWMRHTKTGNLLHGDFPTWLASIEQRLQSYENLTDKRGMCVYSACPHYQRCFIEREQRLSELAKVVISNHTLSLIKLVSTPPVAPTQEDIDKFRMIWDEAHHIFKTADGVFSVVLSIRELSHLRYWILGRETRNRLNTALRRRLQGVTAVDATTAEYVAILEEYASQLPTSHTLQQIESGKPNGTFGTFFHKMHQLIERTCSSNSVYDQEIPLQGLLKNTDSINNPSLKELLADIRELGFELLAFFTHLEITSQDLLNNLKYLKEENPALLEKNDLRAEINGVIRSVETAALTKYQALRNLLDDLLTDDEITLGDFVDRGIISRRGGRVIDIGIIRNFLDPGKPLSQAFQQHTSGLVLTSATLKTKRITNNETSWEEAKQRLGLHHWDKERENAISYASVLSPFDWIANTRFFLVQGIEKGNTKNIEEAFSLLMEASGGGALGLFTALGRMEAVVPGLRSYLAGRGLNLYVQHMDGMATSDITRIFSADEDSCLVGSDALRDGLDVVGPSLRLVIFERLPWARPDILHRKRREVFGRAKYDINEMGWRLRQAFGRLLRHQSDKGILAVLEDHMPSDALASFPDGVKPERVSMAEAVAEIKRFRKS